MRTVFRACLLLPLFLGIAAWIAPCQADPIRIGVLSDMSGPYADFAGMGAVAAAELAIEDFRKAHGAAQIELLQADHQNKPDIAVAIARKWYDREGVSAIVELVHSASALAVATAARDANKLAIISGSSNADLFGKACTANSIYWTYDSWSLAATLAASVVNGGGKTWFFVTSDSISGSALERDVGDAARAAGGVVVGSVRAPVNAPDMSSFLIQAQASKADVIVLALGGVDFSNALKQAQEFRIADGGRRIVAPVMFDTDVHGLGLPVAQRLRAATAFYWDMTEETRAFARRFAARRNGAMPTMVQAGVYAGVLHFLKAATASNPIDGAAVVRKMKELPTDDPLFGRGSIRIDGRKLHPMHVFEVKRPDESKGPWDYLRIIETISADRAIRPLSEGGCPLANNP